METAQVGRKAPDFEAPAYLNGAFTSVKLSDYLGKWVLLCFYPGDFTFVWATEESAVVAHYDTLKQLGVELRGRFIIDPDGIIQAMEVLTPPVGRKIDETIRQVTAFQHVRSTKGAEACPAGWNTGKKVLKPGPDLVGNVWKEWSPKKDL